MKKFIFLLAFFGVLFAACTSIDLATYEDENLYAELETNDPAMVTLLVVNQLNQEIELDRDKLSYAYDGQIQQMSPLVLSQTGTSVPPMVIPPQARLSRSFAPEHLIRVEKGKLVVPQWVPENMDGAVFRFAYKTPEGEKEILFPDTRQRQLLGTVKITNDTVFPFIKSVEARRKVLYDLAHAQAVDSYGSNVRLVNLQYDSAKGFFKESSSLNADVIRGE
ncbi:MAG: hypothetical protein LBL70_01510 [Treponema sp.]|jgi:hypothetical protein|nr:hypothetical protein [Treponema sp.]